MPSIDFYDVAAEIHRLITGKTGAAVAVRKERLEAEKVTGILFKPV